MLTPTADLVTAAAATGVGIPAFNGITIEHAEAIVAGAEAVGLPVILALSHNAVRFHGALRPIAAAYRAVAEGAIVKVGLHLDHVEDLSLVEEGTRLGFGSMMYDGSSLSYDHNVATTTEAARIAHDAGLWLESELGEIGGKASQSSTAHAPHVRTDPDEAAAYVAATGVDALAVAVGSSHAMTSTTASLDLDLVRRLAEAVPVPLVLHGSSGIDDTGLAAAVRAGLVKINIGTQLNIAYTAAVRAGLVATDSPDPRRYLRSARNEMEAVVRRLIGVVGGIPVP